MSKTTEQLKEELHKTKELLKTLRDEIRVKAHLASKDAQDAIAKLDKESEKVANQFVAGTQEAADQLIKAWQDIKKKIES